MPQSNHFTLLVLSVAPQKSSNATYFSQLADNSMSGHNSKSIRNDLNTDYSSIGGATSAQGKQHLINSGAKVVGTAGS